MGAADVAEAEIGEHVIGAGHSCEKGCGGACCPSMASPLGGAQQEPDGCSHIVAHSARSTARVPSGAPWALPKAVRALGGDRSLCAASMRGQKVRRARWGGRMRRCRHIDRCEV